MKLPRKGLLIRLAIYLPLLGFFGWNAYSTWRAEKAAAEELRNAPPPELADPFAGEPTETIDVNGKKVKVYEISPEQAEEYFGVDPEPQATEGVPEATEGVPEATGESGSPPSETAVKEKDGTDGG